MPQNTAHVLMIRPVQFAYNAETATDNAFQQTDSSTLDTQARALAEFNQMVQLLQSKGIHVTVVEDTAEPHTPDSIFPNNWFSTHEEGIMALYPMYALNRRAERRADIAQLLSDEFVMFDMVDFTAHESEHIFLEGTGSLVLDRDLRICYASISSRTNKDLVLTFCKKFGYEHIIFHAFDNNNKPIYHTNVLMCVGEGFMVICWDCIPNEMERDLIRQSTNKEIIAISMQQMQEFAGNMLELVNKQNQHFLVMSNRAYQSLLPEQITRLEKYATILHPSLDTIEQNGGGSARCMIAEIFLNPKK